MAQHSEREVITELLGLYRDLPCLWDMTSELYKDATEKKNAWDILAAKLKDLDPTANVATAKKKIDHLRISYLRESKKVKESKNRTIGSSTSDVHKPSLWYYDLLTFLEKNNAVKRKGVDSLMIMSDDEDMPRYKTFGKSSRKRIRASRQNLEKGTRIPEGRRNTRDTCEVYPEGCDQTGCSTSNEYNLETSNEHQLGGTKRKKNTREHNIELKKEKLIDAAYKLLTTTTVSNAFGVYVGKKIEEIPRGQQRDLAEKLISDVIFLAKTNNLTFDTRIEIPSRTLDYPSHHSTQSFYVHSPPPAQFSPSPRSSSAVSPNSYIKIEPTPSPSSHTQHYSPPPADGE